ncbi:membrane dipeptidase [Sphingorhabdus soli]|uniref:Membrane dipeptidase n=1 Tax=Flavisphingopyxis soli TaxID=2601267 RepID=A0A5C6U4I8_9SPHN|nr:dipeptidase [Sphingorhabdus soli]TXC67739.1 membrane dipeptidase [Sphingorhabdus soli]
MIKRVTIAWAAALLAATSACAGAQETAPGAPVSPEIRALHERLLVLDSHLDSPMHFGRVGWDITQRHSEAGDGTQLDLPRMVEGGLDGGFFVIYMPQGELTPQGYANSFADALRRAAAIHQTVARHDDAMMIATTSADARAAQAAGKRAVFISMENGYPLGQDLSRLALFHGLGVRMAGPVHSRTNQLADSATGEATWGGFSPLGRQWLAEMNRLGMIVDGSHSSDATFDQMIAWSKAPIVLSHSGSKTIFDHKRNIDDARMKTLAEHGGVILVNSVFLGPVNFGGEFGDVLDAMDHVEDLAPADQAALIARRTALMEAKPPITDSFDDFMRALLHCIDVAGVDHVGIGADWDGGGGVAGMKDVSQLPRITAALKAAGYGDDDIAKIWGGNLMRVLDAVEQTAESSK